MPRINRSVLARSVCYTRQQTTVFERAPIVSGSAAVLLGDVDNDPRSEIELAVGGVDGTLAVFKVGHPTCGPYLSVVPNFLSGLGTLCALGLGKLFLGYGDDQKQLIACTEEGVCHIFNIRPADVKWDQESDTGRVDPVWSVTCPKNVTSCCIADIDGDKMQEVVMGTREGGVHVLKMDFNREWKDSGNDRGEVPAEAMGDTPRSDIYSSSSAAPSRLSSPAVIDPRLEPTGDRLSRDEDESDSTQRAAMDPSDSHDWEDRKRVATPENANIPGATPSDAKSAPLSPHLKTLLELKAQDAVTSLSVVHVPETPLVPPATVISCVPASGAATSTSPAQPDGMVDHAGGDRGIPTIHSVMEHQRPDTGGVSPLVKSTTKLEGHEQREATHSAGVYVAVGLETRAVEVMRLSSRRAGTRVLDLVSASERSDRLSSPCDEAASSRGTSHGPLTFDLSGNDFSRIAGDDKDSNDHLRGEKLASQSAEDRDSASQASGEVGNRQACSPVDRDTSPPEEGLLPGTVLCGWHVPADSSSSDEWTGRGLVVGFSDPEPGASPFAPTPRSPLDHTFTKAPKWGWGKTSDSVGARSTCWADRGDEQQVFAVCTMDGCVRCCRIVSTSEGQPQWTSLWTRQTKEALHSFQRLDYFPGSNSRGQAEEGKESLFVVCSWSGNTFIFDAEGTPCVGFDAEAHLEEPLAAFVAGDLTTPSGSTGPSLVYLGTGGKVVAYHGVLEQMESTAPAQFIPSLHKNGSIDTLRELLVNLANRLEWRSSEQGDPLFPPVQPHVANPSSDDETQDVAGDASAVTAAAAASVFSDNEQDSALTLADEILARAVLCPSGVVVALASTARRDERRATGAHGSGIDGRVDGDRWRRQVRALAEGQPGTITVGEGAAAVDRVLREIKAWETRGRDPTLKNFPCLRGTLEALTTWGSGPRRDSLRNALKEAETQAEVCTSPS
ncbi:unnamed protein product [Scytosiphon promiscuus]